MVGDTVQTYKAIQLLIIRGLMVYEFFYSWQYDYLGMWIAQFVICTWYNTFMIASSHDFEGFESAPDLSPGQDWGVF